MTRRRTRTPAAMAERRAADLRRSNEELKVRIAALRVELLRRRPVELRVIAEPVPGTRSECRDGPRPCRAYTCKFHLWIHDERPGRPWDGRRPAPIVEPATIDTCAMDVAERNPEGLDLREVGAFIGIGGERARQIEERALEKLKAARDQLADPGSDPMPWWRGETGPGE